MRARLPATVRNPLSIVGICVVTATGLLFVVLFLLELLGLLTNPYMGLLVFVAVPALFLVGLILVPLGAWGRSRRSQAATDWPVIDLGNSRQRSLIAGIVGLTLVNIVLVSLAAYGGIHYMESPAFCGQVCHTTMEPQFTAHQIGPHAQVSCTACHVGPGAGAMVESKLAGARQLWHVMTRTVPTPVRAPAERMRPARETCEQCHWRDRFEADEVRVVRSYASDEANSESAMPIQMHVGRAAGTGRNGIHGHMALDVEFVPRDRTLAEIPYVRARYPDGAVREFVAEGGTGSAAQVGPRRTMDCLDCHNRPAHTFFPTAERAVDAAIASGRVPRQLPFVRREVLAAVAANHADRGAALAGIASRLSEFFESRGADATLVRRTIQGAQDVYSSGVFPEMKVTWGTYPNHLGHVETPGCFRCHDDRRSTDGRVLSQDCALCHAFP